MAFDCLYCPWPSIIFIFWKSCDCFENRVGSEYFIISDYSGKILVHVDFTWSRVALYCRCFFNTIPIVYVLRSTFRRHAKRFRCWAKNTASQIWIWSDFVFSSVFEFERETYRGVWRRETKNLLVGSSSAVVRITGVGFWRLPVAFDKSRSSTRALCWTIWDTVNLEFSDLENDICCGIYDEIERDKTIATVWHLRGDWPTPSAGEYGGSESGGLSGKLCLKKLLLFFFLCQIVTVVMLILYRQVYLYFPSTRLPFQFESVIWGGRRSGLTCTDASLTFKIVLRPDCQNNLLFYILFM